MFITRFDCLAFRKIKRKHVIKKILGIIKMLRIKWHRVFFYNYFIRL